MAYLYKMVFLSTGAVLIENVVIKTTWFMAETTAKLAWWLGSSAYYYYYPEETEMNKLKSKVLALEDQVGKLTAKEE